MRERFQRNASIPQHEKIRSGDEASRKFSKLMGLAAETNLGQIDA